MSTSSPFPDDVEKLISRFCRPLAPADQVAFRAAAEDAVARISCWGEGAVYRAIASAQRVFFVPPAYTGWTEQDRPSKLKSAEAIEYGGDLRHVRYHKR